MKIRMGFVSNSSSSSFVIGKSKITPEQIIMAENAAEICRKRNWQCGYLEEDSNYTGWSITEQDDYYEFYTSMDNFDMREFLEHIGVSKEVMTWN